MSAMQARLSFSEIAAAVSGALFCGITGYIAVGAAIWALCQSLHAPLAILSGVEIFAGAAFLAMTVALLRHALKLARTGWA